MCVRVCCCMSSSLHDVRRGCLGNRSRQHHNNVNQRGVAMRSMWHTHTHIHCWVFLWWHPRAVTEHTHSDVCESLSAAALTRCRLKRQILSCFRSQLSSSYSSTCSFRSCNTNRKNTISSFFYSTRGNQRMTRLCPWKAKTLSDFSLPDLPLRSPSHTSLDSFQHL